MKPFFILIAACGTVGIVLGGTASRASINECMSQATPTNECLMQNPNTEIVEGMSGGLIAGTCAAIGATWQLRKKDS